MKSLNEFYSFKQAYIEKILLNKINLNQGRYLYQEDQHMLLK